MTTRNAILAIAFATLATACGERDDKKEAPSDFCPTALCGPGTVCDEEQDKCVPASDFCPTALCGPGTVCDEEQDKCVPE